MLFAFSKSLPRIVSAGFIAITLAVGSPVRADAQTASRQYTVKAPDGVTLAVQESGNPAGRPVVLVHGLLGSHLSWKEQVEAPRLQGFRLITFDMRGHGQSGGPSGTTPYTEGRRWAADLQAVIRASGAKRPVLVGWSLGAAVISNYLAAYGDDGIGGVVYVGGVVELEASQIVPHPDVYRDMGSRDLRTHLDAERAFLRLCFHRQPDDADFQRLLANAAMASFDMQQAVHGMTVEAAKGLATLHKPMLQIYGEQDALVNAQAASRRAKALHPAIRTIFYADAGHAPFVEVAERFNEDLARFVDGL